MKYKVGNKVRIKSINWYDANSNGWGSVCFCDTPYFISSMKQYCGKVMTIAEVKKGVYHMKEDNSLYDWVDNMIEGLAEEETKFGTASNPIEPKSNAICLTQEKVDETKSNFNVGNKITNGKTQLTILTILSDKYIVEDNFGECGVLYFNTQDDWKLVEEENKKEDIAWMYDGKLVAERFSDGVTIQEPKYNKLSINTEFCDDKVELVISPDFELKQEGDKWFAVKKQKEYPKTYEECCKVLGIQSDWHLTLELDNPATIDLCVNKEFDYVYKLEVFRKLLICRDAYWKIAGEEMVLEKSWKPDWSNKNELKYCIENRYDKGIHYDVLVHTQKILAFPTAEMRDVFYENFKDLIEQCKELL